MSVQFLIDRFQNAKDITAVITNDVEYSYGDLLRSYHEASDFVSNDIPSGSVVSIKADFSLKSIAFFLALISNNNLIVPISTAVKTIDEYYSIANVQYEIDLRDDIPCVSQILPREVTLHEIQNFLKTSGHPGLILFSSGSTGKSKAAVHDLIPLLEKFHVLRPAMRSLTFLLFDHIGGFNTMFHILSNTGTIVTTVDRSPESICSLIEKFKIELLPTSPTFLNLLLMTRAHEKHNISSLKLITYGTETMPEYVLSSFHRLYPDVKMKQTYGLSELGIMRSLSKSDDSLWIKIGGEGYQTKIVDDILFIKATSAMLGYLNAPNPFDKDGWFNTHDKVEVDGEWIKILGRVSDIINVGGQKVYPSEVESVLQSMENVKDASVYGSKNPIMGSVVSAKVCLNEPENLASFKKKMREFCKTKLEPFKVPVNIEIVDNLEVSGRFKKVRK